MRSAAALSALRNDLRTARCHKYRDLEGEAKLVGWFQIFVYVHLYLGKIPNLKKDSSNGWLNHQPEQKCL